MSRTQITDLRPLSGGKPFAQTSRPADEPWQALIQALPPLMQVRELDKQLVSLSELFSECWPEYYLVWHWRGRKFPPLHRVCPEQLRHSCNNLLSARIYGDEPLDKVTQQEMKAWIQATGDLLASLSRSQMGRSDFNTLADIRDLLDQCIYIRAANQYVELFVNEGMGFLFRVNLHQVEAMFGEHFCRVHRSYLINPKAVSNVERKRNGRYVLKIRDEMIPVGDGFLAQVKEQQPHWFASRPRNRALDTWLYRRD
ncbi:LytTR family DNA-binding domain-containing protein [Ferrimonas balearica]|uniref:LytTR family DNA-binding domain-containing protein n=1 Tax=Ferrimonas balearica TaxID=44012 RepID=UPI001C990F50|nr:LytTR family DNA-binding domain-containing protein [Ferrimonas balearica]MBY5991532.1 LytTR family transcriptional regulator [Ferrimonas balearica]